MEVFLQLVLFSVLVEAVVEGIKGLREEGKLNTNVLVSLVLSLVAAVAFGIDIFAMAGFATQVPLIGEAMTGVIISRGSNFVSDLVGRLQ